MSRNPDRPLADTIFISEFAAFARAKGDETYDFMNTENCALAQFVRGAGLATAPHCDGYGYWPEGEDVGTYEPISDALGDLLVQSCGHWSALADHLEALLADSPAVSRRIDKDGGSST